MIDLYLSDPWSWAFVIHKPYPRRIGYLVGTDASVWCCWIFDAKLKCPVQTQTYRRLKVTGVDSIYPTVHLGFDGPNRSTRIHTMVLETFVGPRPPQMECRHLNGFMGDARLSNLRWGTKKENGADTRKHRSHHRDESHRRGSRNPNSNLTEDDVREIRRLYRQGTPRRELAKSFPVSFAHLKYVINGTFWPHVGP